MELAQLHKGNADILDNLKPHFLAGSGYDIQSHAVHLDGDRVLLLLKVYIHHIDSESPGLRELLALDDFRVLLQSLLKLTKNLRHLIVLILDSKVEHHRISKLDIDSIYQISLFLLFSQCFFLSTGFLSFFQSLHEFLFQVVIGTLFHQLIDLAFQGLKVLFRRVFGLLIQIFELRLAYLLYWWFP